MRLKEIFKKQKDFLKNFVDLENLTEVDRIKFTKEYILSIHRELGEILDTIPWKLHRKNEVSKSEANTTEEIIDCFKFLLNLCILWDVDDNRFVNEFERKSNVVSQRYYQEFVKVISKEDKVCAIDLDDTLADSDEHFTKIYNKKYNTIFKTRQEIKEANVPLAYESFKEWYRESGEKINIPAKKGAKELCKFLKEKGYKIVIISARPYQKHNRIFSDTLQWLNDNQIQFDALYFEKDKHIKILKEIPHMSFMIEDDIDYAKQVSDLKYKVYLLSETKLENENITVVNNLFDIIKLKINE
jgi:5'(3')-deoxyribonucleotidase